MIPYGLEFGVGLVVLIVSIKFGFWWGVGTYIAYRVFLKD